MDSNGSHTRWLKSRPLAWAGVLLALAYLPLLALYFRDLWLREHYRFVPVLLLFVVLMGWKRWRDAQVQQRELPVKLLVACFGSAFLLLALASVLRSPALAYLSAVLAAGGGLMVATRRRAMRHAFGVWCLLLLGIRLPFQLDLQLIVELQTLTTAVGSRVLDGLSIMHLTDGHVLSCGAKDFFIDQACSGVMSFMALFAVGALLAVMHNRAFIHSLILILVACAWALLMNVLRILTIAIVYVRWEVDLAVGWRHEALGVATFLVAMAGIMSTDRLLRYVLSPASRRRSSNLWLRGWDGLTRWGEPGRGERPAVSRERSADFPLSWERGGLCALVVLLGIQISAGAFGRTVEVPQRSEIELPVPPHAFLEKDSIKPPNASWMLVAFDKIERDRLSAWGEHSLIWTFQQDDTVIRFALDYPFHEHHDLRICYAGRGWKTLYRQVVEEDRSAAEVDFYKEMTNEHAYSLAGAIDAAGDWLPWPQQTMRGRVEERFLRGRSDERGRKVYYQLQTFVVASHRLGSFQRSDLRGAFQSFRSQVAEQINLLREVPQR